MIALSRENIIEGLIELRKEEENESKLIIDNIKDIIPRNRTGIITCEVILTNRNFTISTEDRKVKTSIITKKFGYNIYVIKDMGHYNPSFVKEQFDTFMKFVYFI